MPVAAISTICSSASAASIMSPTVPRLPNNIRNIISSGAIVSIVYLPSSVRISMAMGFTRTESVRITARPNIFLPMVCPFFSHSTGIANSSAIYASNTESDIIASES